MLWLTEISSGACTVVALLPVTLTRNGVFQLAALKVMVLVAALNCPAWPALAAENASPAILAANVTDTVSPLAGAWVSATEYVAVLTPCTTACASCGWVITTPAAARFTTSTATSAIGSALNAALLLWMVLLISTVCSGTVSTPATART